MILLARNDVAIQLPAVYKLKEIDLAAPMSLDLPGVHLELEMALKCSQGEILAQARCLNSPCAAVNEGNYQIQWVKVYILYCFKALKIKIILIKLVVYFKVLKIKPLLIKLIT